MTLKKIIINNNKNYPCIFDFLLLINLYDAIIPDGDG